MPSSRNSCRCCHGPSDFSCVLNDFFFTSSQLFSKCWLSVGPTAPGIPGCSLVPAQGNPYCKVTSNINISDRASAKCAVNSELQSCIILLPASSSAPNTYYKNFTKWQKFKMEQRLIQCLKNFFLLNILKLVTHEQENVLTVQGPEIGTSGPEPHFFAAPVPQYYVKYRCYKGRRKKKLNSWIVNPSVEDAIYCNK
jgi:hypothetical protein